MSFDGNLKVHENYAEQKEGKDRQCWVEDCGWHLHSNGEVYLRCPEYFPNRKLAETILAKYPDAAPPVVEPSAHVWAHGDIFESRVSGCLMIYISPSSGSAFVTRLSGHVSTIHNTLSCTIGAKFLFNINDVASDAVKERQAAIDEARRVAEAMEDINRAVPPQGQREFGGLG